MGLIAALLPNAAHVQRLKAAVKDMHEVEPVSDWPALFALCEQNPVQIAVIDLYAEGTVRFDQIRQLRSREKRIALIAYVAVSVERSRDLFDAGRAGFEGLIVADREDSPRAIQTQIALSESRGMTSHVRRMIGDVDPVARDALLIAVGRAHERLSPDSLARALGVHRRQLYRILLDAGFPRPHRLLTWGRLISAAFLLEDVKHRANGVAQLLRFPSGSAFRNTCQRYVHAAPHQIRKRGGSAYVIRVLQRELRAATRLAEEPQTPAARKSSRSPRLAV